MRKLLGRRLSVLGLIAALFAGPAVAADAATASTATGMGELPGINFLVASAPVELTAGHFLHVGPAGLDLVMQADGNLVLYYSPAGLALWASDTVGRGSTFSFQGDGNAVLRDRQGRALWATYTQTANNTGENKRVLVINSTGRWAVYRGQTSPTALFATPLRLSPSVFATVGTLGGQPGESRLVMQSDGNLVVRAAAGNAVWASGTAGHPGAVLVLQTDLNMVIYQQGRALWNTGTAVGSCARSCAYLPLLALTASKTRPEALLVAEPGDHVLWGSVRGRQPAGTALGTTGASAPVLSGASLGGATR